MINIWKKREDVSSVRRKQVVKRATKAVLLLLGVLGATLQASTIHGADRTPEDLTTALWLDAADESTITRSEVPVSSCIGAELSARYPTSLETRLRQE
jgi:hypothetical protein